MVIRLEDFVMRRRGLKPYLEFRSKGEDYLHELAGGLGGLLGWNKERKQSEVANVLAKLLPKYEVAEAALKETPEDVGAVSSPLSDNNLRNKSIQSPIPNSGSPMVKFAASPLQSSKIELGEVYSDASLVMKQKEYDFVEELLLVLLESLKIYPEDVNLQMLLGRVYLETKRFDAAIEKFTKILALPSGDENQTNSKNSKALLNRALALIYKEEFEAAKKDLLEAVSLKPDDDFAYANLGNVFAALGNEDLALENWERADKLKFKSPGLSYNLAVVYLEKGKREEAKEKIRELINMDIYPYNWQLKLLQATESKDWLFILDTKGIFSSFLEKQKEDFK